MTGLDKMKSQILNEAKAAADGKVAEAKRQAEEMINLAKEEAEKKRESISRKSEADVQHYQERTASSIDLQRRTKLLAAKQEVIAEVLDKAYEKLSGMEEEEYFAMLLKILVRYMLPEEGEIFFSAKDLQRMPSGYEEQIQKAARENGGTLTLSKEGRSIENGFVLAYGGIEENCTLRAMLDAKKDELSDMVHRLLFL